jgi:hypothetical protein
VWDICTSGYVDGNNWFCRLKSSLILKGTRRRNIDEDYKARTQRKKILAVFILDSQYKEPRLKTNTKPKVFYNSSQRGQELYAPKLEILKQNYLSPPFEFNIKMTTTNYPLFLGNVALFDMRPFISVSREH